MPRERSELELNRGPLLPRRKQFYLSSAARRSIFAGAAVQIRFPGVRYCDITGNSGSDYFLRFSARLPGIDRPFLTCYIGFKKIV